MKINRHFILASASPRRKKLLENLGFNFQVKKSTFTEITIPENPKKTAITNAKGKAIQIAAKHPQSLILGVDTVVSYENQIFGKPQNPQHAKKILKTLSGSTHKVISAIHLIDGQTNTAITKIATTQVTLISLTESQITQYVNSKEGLDKAAGYAIQGLFALYVKKINGDYFNVVGLPINTLHQALQELKIQVVVSDI